MARELSSALDASSALYRLWLDGSLVDCELETGDGNVHSAHRVILAASSRFFQALFTGAWRDVQQYQQQQQQHQASDGTSTSSRNGSVSGLPRFKISGVCSASLQLLLHAIYSKRLPLTGEGVGEELPLLLAASNYLEVLPVKEACCRHLRSQLSVGSVAETLALAAAYDCQDLMADAARFFETHFSQLLKSEEAASLAVLPPELLQQLLSSDALDIQSELEVARAALLWAAADPAQRAPLLEGLLPAARMPPGQLQEEAARCGLLAAGGAVCLQPPGQRSDALQQQQQQWQWQPWKQQQQQQYEGESWQQLATQPSTPTQQAEHVQGLQLYSQELGHAFINACQQLQNNVAVAAAAVGMEVGVEGTPVLTYRPRLAAASGLIMAGGLDDGWRPLRTVELYDPHTDCWTPGPLMPAPCSFAAASMLGGQTLVVEGAAHAPSVLALDRQARRWRQVRGLATPRINMAVAALEDRLFVLGGRAGVGGGAAVLSDVEVWDPATDSWLPAAPMAQPRTALAATALGGKLYAVGGQDSRSTHASAECFDPECGRWVQLGGGMQQPRKYLGVAVAAGRLIAVGGMTGARMRVAAAEALDPREGRWQPLPPMTMARSSCGVTALHDCVYVVGGNIGAGINDTFAGVEAWVPSAGRWRQLAPISHGRSGQAVAPI